jgi:hypothetical protein
MTRGLLVLALAFASMGPPAAPDPVTWLAESRVAMGGNAAFSGVTEVKLGGNLISSRAVRSSHIAWEATWQVPDRFLMQETHTIPTPVGANAMTTKTGFRGETSLHEIVSSALSGLGPFALGAPLSPQEKADKNAREVRAARRLLVRLMVPLFASVDIVSTVMPLTMTAGADVAMPGGPAHLITFSGPDEFSMGLLLDTASHLPVLLTWQGPPLAVGSAPRPGSVAPAPKVPDVEHQFRFEDFATKDGRHWPRRIVHIIAGTAYAEFRVNKHSVKR